MTHIVQHYKGGRYMVLDEAIESTNARQGTKVVIYFSLEKETWHTRDADEFHQVIIWADGHERPRFMKVDKK